MIVVNFNVLAGPHDDFAQRQPVREGMDLWRTFFDQKLGHVGLVVDLCPNRDILDHWLKINMIKPVVTHVLDTNNPFHKANKVHQLVSLTGRQDWYVDVDPQTLRNTLKLGIPSMLVSVPYVVRPEWVTKDMTPWDELVEEIDRQKLMKAERDWNSET